VAFDRGVEARPIEVAAKSRDGLFDALVAGDGDVMGLLQEGGAEGGGDVEAAVGGIEEVVLEGEVGARALGDSGEDVLVSRVGGSLAADGV
jgi:hypothetical protein